MTEWPRRASSAARLMLSFTCGAIATKAMCSDRSESLIFAAEAPETSVPASSNSVRNAITDGVTPRRCASVVESLNFVNLCLFWTQASSAAIEQVTWFHSPRLCRVAVFLIQINVSLESETMPLHNRSSPAAVIVADILAPTDKGKDTPHTFVLLHYRSL